MKLAKQWNQSGARWPTYAGLILPIVELVRDNGQMTHVPNLIEIHHFLFELFRWNHTHLLTSADLLMLTYFWPLSNLSEIVAPWAHVPSFIKIHCILFELPCWNQILSSTIESILHWPTYVGWISLIIELVRDIGHINSCSKGRWYPSRFVRVISLKPNCLRRTDRRTDAGWGVIP